MHRNLFETLVNGSFAGKIDALREEKNLYL